MTKTIIFKQTPMFANHVISNILINVCKAVVTLPVRNSHAVHNLYDAKKTERHSRYTFSVFRLPYNFFFVRKSFKGVHFQEAQPRHSIQQNTTHAIFTLLNFLNLNLHYIPGIILCMLLVFSKLLFHYIESFS